MSPLPEGSLSQQHREAFQSLRAGSALGRPDAMTVPSAPLAHDPFANDAQRRGSRVR